jgi:hypothetical protein
MLEEHLNEENYIMWWDVGPRMSVVEKVVGEYTDAICDQVEMNQEKLHQIMLAC